MSATDITRRLLALAAEPSESPRLVPLHELVTLGAIALDDLAELKAAGLRFWGPADPTEDGPRVWVELRALLAAASTVAEQREKAAANVH